ncbi:OmpA family protein [Alkalimarinus sediminis]|uniref:OmpA family protein n=1 Tax=Alkalimarinus sediminis TaxID=1632866 RepID=A0A9E8HMC0_9ALTE|nr:OmpA family protein [Alkalimarinus sediminis]UZW75972.1 OmpA family protein [Alkalimarinus sediminis]
MSRYKHALPVIAAYILSGCQAWPEAGKGGVSEVRSSEHYYISEIGYAEDVSTLQYQLDHSRLTLDMLIVKGAKNCLPASVRTTARLMNRVQREIDGDLLDDAYSDLVVVAESLQKMRNQLSYVTYSTQCASHSAPKSDSLLAELALNTLKVDVQFDQSSAEISQAYTTKLNSFAQQYQTLASLTSYPLKINIHAHTDTNGSSVSNSELAHKRASTVKSALINADISEYAVNIVNSGDQAPLLNGDAIYSHGLNRRVEVSVSRVLDHANTGKATLPLKEWEQSAPMLFEPK